MTPAARRATALAVICTVVLLAGRAAAAQECRFSVDPAGGAARQTHTLAIGEFDRRTWPALRGVTNHGPHDVRLVFDGAPPRQLGRDAREPTHGELGAGVVLRSVECLPARSAAGAFLQRAAASPTMLG